LRAYLDDPDERLQLSAVVLDALEHAHDLARHGRQHGPRLVQSSQPVGGFPQGCRDLCMDRLRQDSTRLPVVDALPAAAQLFSQPGEVAPSRRKLIRHPAPSQVHGGMILSVVTHSLTAIFQPE
jgi:cation diffusion facilitator CzcD-associated flavoprotein CzcO